MTISHSSRVTTTKRLYATRYEAECTCGFSVGTFPHRTQAAAAAEEHLERSETLGDLVEWA